VVSPLFCRVFASAQRVAAPQRGAGAAAAAQRPVRAAAVMPVYASAQRVKVWQCWKVVRCTAGGV